MQHSVILCLVQSLVVLRCVNDDALKMKKDVTILCVELLES